MRNIKAIIKLTDSSMASPVTRTLLRGYKIYNQDVVKTKDFK